MSTHTNPPHLLTVPEVAERLGISLRSVRRMIADGQLPTIKIRHAVRISADALAAYLAEQTRTRPAVNR